MKKLILLIEDNEQNRYMETYLLEKEGYEVISAGDGHAGIQKAKERIPELILLDIQLPGMDGYEVARYIKNSPAMSKTPIVAITSYAMAGDRERALSSGCDGYMEKPINPDTFVQEIRKFIGN